MKHLPFFLARKMSGPSEFKSVRTTVAMVGGLLGPRSFLPLLLLSLVAVFSSC